MRRIIKSLTNNKKLIIVGIIMFFINYFLLLKQNNIYVTRGNNSIFKYIITLLIIMHFIVFIVLKKMISKKMPPEKVFLVFGIMFGTLFMFFIPFGYTPDEANHFLRSYEISTGNLISIKKENEVGNYLPTNIEKVISHYELQDAYKNEKENLSIKFNNEKKFYNFANTSLYSFICYLPQSIGIMIGRLLKFPILITAYLGRILNFSLWIALIYLAIKKIPIGKNLILFISMLPMSLQEAVSLAPDAMTNCVSISLVSFVLYHLYNKNEFDKKNMIIASILCIAISMLKIVYLPLCLLLILIPDSKFKSKKNKYFKICSLAMLVILLNLIWLKISSNFLIEFMPGVDSGKQVMYILNHPYSYFSILFNTYEYYSITYMFTMLGSNMEYLNVYVSQPCLLIYFLFIIYAAMFDTNIVLEKKVKYLFSFVSVCIILLISTSLYVQWTSYMNPEILGIQGRYFLPILLPLMLLFSRKFKKNATDFSKIYYYIFATNCYVVLLLLYTHI
ncbi:MAG: DUF2142 domain-containing protein [Firmicutes bacterium]|nr:DUF2142 domain-containing protein [Bacillota bacterium]